MENNIENVSNFDMTEFLNNLNEAQREAVLSCGQPQLVLSGAGSGKTRVLTYKIIFLLKTQNISPENILALTFTNKAANEMKERIWNLIGPKYTKQLMMGTFHSTFCKILRKNIIHLEGKKYKSYFKIIVEHEVKDIIKSILEDNFYNEVEDYLDKKLIMDKNNVNRQNMVKSLVKKFMEKIKLLKNRGITWDKYYNLQVEIDKDKFDNVPFFKSVYKKYVETCQEKNVMDFEDLLLNTFLLFSDINNIQILNKYQNLFKYVLVDEYQDTNSIQYEIVKALSWQHKNLFVVGDDYQNIYSFRGATRLNIDRFLKDFNNVKITKLCQNYRSNKTIVNIASKLIENNVHQIKKKLFSEIDETEGKLKLMSCFNGIDEATKIAYIIQKLIADNKCNYNDIAILYRINLQHIPFKQVFFKMGIPHKISNANTIFDSKYIKIIYYYLQFIDDQTLDFCLPKIINFPKRGIGKSTVDKLFSLAKSYGVSCWEIINNCDNKEKINKYQIPKEMQTKFIPFKQLINYLISFSKTNRLKETVLELFKCINIYEYTKEDSNKEQIELLLEKVTEMEEEHIKNSIDKFTLNEFLEDFSLLVTNDESDENESKKNRVKLMTIHQAKGLEFKYVFIVGLEEGYYPCGSHVTDIEELEEERRILYVAITRAKINCYLSYAHQRQRGDENTKRHESPFLLEIYDFNLIQNYFIEEEQNYKLFKNKYMDISKKAKETQIKKIKNEEKCRKFINLNYIKEKENENEINQIKKDFENNSYKYNINNINSIYNINNLMDNPFLSNRDDFMKKFINIEKFDINKNNNDESENNELGAKLIKNFDENLNNDNKEITNEITKDKKKRVKKEKKEKIEKVEKNKITEEKKEKKEKLENNKKKKLKFKTIDSFFNTK